MLRAVPTPSGLSIFDRVGTARNGVPDRSTTSGAHSPSQTGVNALMAHPTIYSGLIFASLVILV
jgi:hypothetical protein